MGRCLLGVEAGIVLTSKIIQGGLCVWRRQGDAGDLPDFGRDDLMKVREGQEAQVSYTGRPVGG